MTIVYLRLIFSSFFIGGTSKKANHSSVLSFLLTLFTIPISLISPPLEKFVSSKIADTLSVESVLSSSHNSTLRYVASLTSWNCPVSPSAPVLDADPKAKYLKLLFAPLPKKPNFRKLIALNHI